MESVTTPETAPAPAVADQAAEAVFLAELFARVAAEDRARYSPESLAEIARESTSRHRQRTPGKADIHVVDAVFPGTGAITIIEIFNDDMPFLLDSTLAELAEHGVELLLVAHPIFAVERDMNGGRRRLVGVSTGREIPPVQRESCIHIHVRRLLDPVTRAAVQEGLTAVFAEVRNAVADWLAMRGRLAEVATRYRTFPPLLPADEIAEAVQFLDWLLADNFTFLGMREYRFADPSLQSEPEPSEGLGILRDPNVKVLRRGAELVVMSPDVRAFLMEPQPLIITKASVKSHVHRRVHMDYVGVKLIDPAGQLAGELRVLGLFTSTAYTVSTRAIPYVRHKVANVFAKAGFDPASHSGKALLNVLESYPRDELFQLDSETLYQFALDILSLTERPRLRVLPRIDRFDRFVSVMVFVPKDRYDTGVRQRIGAHLARVYEGRLSAAYPAYPEGPLARTHYIIGRYGGETPRIDRATLEGDIQAIVRTWTDGLKSVLARNADVSAGWFARYADAFTAAYREAFPPQDALRDIGIIERLSEVRPHAIDFYRRPGDALSRANLKVFARGAPISLSRRVPVLEDLGFTVINERTYRVAPPDTGGAVTWLHDMTLERARGGDIDVARLDPAIEATLTGILDGTVETDRFNGLVVEAGLDPFRANLIRAYARYLRQIGAPYAQAYIADVLAKYPAIATDLVALFERRFDPRLPGEANERAAAADAIRQRIRAAIDTIASLDEDRILRRLLNLIDATLRTNAYQHDPSGRRRPTLALKFACAEIDALPLPKPLFEIFVTSPQVEGLHLRFGKVARGGLRWSDRPMDFRTEILGLVKAQQVKNAVIVPVGAKGGFVPKRLPSPANRDAWLAEGTSAYVTFVSALIDLTDTFHDGTIVPPADVVRYDPDDPYLVVAADKGTATFSDTANGIAEARGHWLADAFASGGSAGYDHKKMAITARGAWEAVKRHFREMDRDIQREPFTVAGVGDMSGDVFGNGMLLSPVIRLIAAFDHRDIFLDPSPDAANALAERQRLFALPRSSWQDYDKSLISKGGGVFSRALKQIELSPEVQAVLGLERAAATPQEVMQAILRAPVDLLWFGGIGTYIRAGDETDADVGDRANDAIRITGAMLRAKVIGEGANLGATQKGRIEAARAGVRLNTDAIDNSAGVNSSDVEVNLKIALATPERDGRLSRPARNELLVSMTDDVARLVLRNNYLQSLALSLAERLGPAGIGAARRLMRALEARGRLDRGVEFLPSDAELTRRERAGEALTRPELAVLLAYSKIVLFDDLVESALPDDPYLADELTRYFPPALRERFPDAITGHRLRREIVATQLANAVINRCGPGSVVTLSERTGADAASIARAYILTRDAFGFLDLNTALDDHDGRIPGAMQLQLYAAVQSAVIAGLSWFVKNGFATAPLGATVERFRAGIIAAHAAAKPPEAEVSQAADLAAAGLDPQTAARFASLPRLVAAPDAVLTAQRAGVSIPLAVEVAGRLSQRLGLERLGGLTHGIAAADETERQAIGRLTDGLDRARRRLVTEAITAPDGFDAWHTQKTGGLDRAALALGETLSGPPNLAKLALAHSVLEELSA